MHNRIFRIFFAGIWKFRAIGDCFSTRIRGEPWYTVSCPFLPWRDRRLWFKSPKIYFFGIIRTSRLFKWHRIASDASQIITLMAYRGSYNWLSSGRYNSTGWRIFTVTGLIEDCLSSCRLRFLQGAIQLLSLFENEFFLISFLQSRVHADSVHLMLSLLLLQFIIKTMQIICVCVIWLNITFDDVTRLHQKLKQKWFSFCFMFILLLQFCFGRGSSIFSTPPSVAEWNDFLDAVPRLLTLLQRHEHVSSHL